MSQCSVATEKKNGGFAPAMPSLIGVSDRPGSGTNCNDHQERKRTMPGFPNLTEDQVFALVDYLTSGESKELATSEPPPLAMKISLHRISQIPGP